MHLPDGCEQYIRQQRSEVGDRFVEVIASEFEQLRPFLQPGHVVDIGCGLGAMTALMQPACGGIAFLVDGDGWATRRVGFGDTMQPFNNTALTEALLRLNGVQDFAWLPVGTRRLPATNNVVSLLSWGWHYPIATYIDAVVDALQPDGSLIVDIRDWTDGQRVLQEHFRGPDTICRVSNKGWRTHWRAY